MSRIFNRPMFKRGGSAGQGITSGLDRPGYANGLDVQKIRELKKETLGMYGQPPRGYGVYDFLTDWGLRMASSPPSGNVLQTAAMEARQPHERLVAGKGEAEMAQYLAGVKATDKAIDKTTAMEIAEMEALGRAELKKVPYQTQVAEMQEAIMKTAQMGSFDAKNSGGLATGRVWVVNENAKGLYDLGVIENYKAIGTGENKAWGFEETELDANKVWYNPKAGDEGWVIFRDVNKDGKGDGEPIKVGSLEEGRAILKAGIKPKDIGYKGLEDIEQLESEVEYIPPKEKLPHQLKPEDFIISHTEKMKDFAKNQNYSLENWMSYEKEKEKDKKLAGDALGTIDYSADQ